MDISKVSEHSLPFHFMKIHEETGRHVGKVSGEKVGGINRSAL